jgi:hypothetical protein
MSTKKKSARLTKPPLSLHAPIDITYIAELTRNKYFAGKVLSEQDFTAEQTYVREKVRLHNLNLHGWGIASGLKVSTTSDRKGIVVSPGMALDRYGRELVLHRPVVIQLPPERRPWWLTLTYTERETDRMPTPIPSDSNEDSVQHSRIEEGIKMSYEPDDPCARHAPGPSGEDYSIAIAKLAWKRSRWQIATRRPCPRLR